MTLTIRIQTCITTGSTVSSIITLSLLCLFIYIYIKEEADTKRKEGDTKRKEVEMRAVMKSIIKRHTISDDDILTITPEHCTLHYRPVHIVF